MGMYVMYVISEEKGADRIRSIVLLFARVINLNYILLYMRWRVESKGKYVHQQRNLCDWQPERRENAEDHSVCQIYLLWKHYKLIF